MSVEIATKFTDSAIPFNTFSDEVFAQKLKTQIINSPQPEGYCTKTQVMEYPVKKRDLCDDDGFKHVGWIWKFQFNDPEDANYEIDFGTDMDGGSIIYVNGVLESVNQYDYWWGHLWEGTGVYTLNHNFKAGQNLVETYGSDQCCDGGFNVQFSRNNQKKMPLNQENLLCAVTNHCPFLNCNQNQYNDGPECKDCPYFCGTCENNTTCQTCPSGSFRDSENNCSCEDGYYNIENQAQCGRCHTSCKTCLNNSTCESCHPNQYHNSICYDCSEAHGDFCGTCSEQTCLSCLNNPINLMPHCDNQSNCLEKEYKDGLWCLDCITNCKECDNGSTCITCMDKYFKTDESKCQRCHESCKTCSDQFTCDSCEDNEYLDGTCKSCSQTHGNICGTCTKLKCSSCLNNQQYLLPNCTQASCQQNQVQEGNWCIYCPENCLTCNINTCTRCEDKFYTNDQGECSPCHESCKTCINGNSCQSCENDHHLDPILCKPCSQSYNQYCSTCNNDNCLSCMDPLNKLPECISQNCRYKQFDDSGTCRPCLPGCQQCENEIECSIAEDTYYLDIVNVPQKCQQPCLLCTSFSTCTLCSQKGFQPPSCTECDIGFYSHQNTCISQCPIGFFGNSTSKNCEECDDSCFDCQNDKYNCLICPNLKILFNGKCVDCGDIPGMEQDPEEPIGICREICGDGYRTPTSTHECDDGNTENGDGCDEYCQIEEGFKCIVPPVGHREKTICIDISPIGFTVDFQFEDQYLNIEEQSPISCIMSFNKTFTLPQNILLKDLIVLSVDGKNTQGFDLNITEIKEHRVLQENQLPQYNLSIIIDQTLKNRDISIDLFPKSAFDDGHGNILADESPPKGKVKEYYYYTEEERDDTRYFQDLMFVGILCLMIFLPIYVFWYKNHLNRFYVIFFVLDITQTLYFYRFLNLRWPINGIKFFRTLRPTINFYISNFFYQEISDEDFPNYSSGVTKFDLEKESSLFLNNTGSILVYFLALSVLYGIVVLFSKGLFGKKYIKTFTDLKLGYFQWGILFDAMLAMSGVFIIYTLLQLLNYTTEPLNSSIATIMGIIYLVFFFKTFIYINKNLKKLYTPEKDEILDDMTIQQKLIKNPTFKLRNAWFFIDRLSLSPKKAYFFFFFIVRKFYLATILILMQNYPTIQLCMCSFSHFVVVVAFWKYKFFKLQRENLRIIVSETLIFIGVGTCYFLLDDKSEDEHYRLKYCWIVLSCLLSSLMIHGIFFLIFEVIIKIIEKCLKRENLQKIRQLRLIRNQQKRINTEVSISPEILQNNNNNQEVSPVIVKKSKFKKQTLTSLPSSTFTFEDTNLPSSSRTILNQVEPQLSQQTSIKINPNSNPISEINTNSNSNVISPNLSQMYIKTKKRTQDYDFKRTNSSEIEDTIVSNSEGKQDNSLLDKDEHISQQTISPKNHRKRQIRKKNKVFSQFRQQALSEKE